MSNEIFVSVVVPTFNRFYELERALRSILKQSFKDYEIIVVDDNLDSNASSKVKDICKNHSACYVKNKRKKGGCGARNTGILEAKGKYIAFLDDDDYWLENKLSTQISFMEENGINCSFTNFFIFYQNQRFFKKSTFKEKYLTYQDFMMGSCPASTSLVILKTDILKKSGLFDEDLPSFQDFDLWIRVSEITNFYVCEKHLSIFTFHQGDRTSVNVDKRIDGLNRIMDKWGKYINEYSNAFILKKRFVRDAYHVNALSNQGVDYFKALQFRFLVVREDFFNFKNHIALALSLFGGGIYWYLSRRKKVSCSKLISIMNNEYLK
jgi:glycosyltransferase involved in cell wall biosynthesis